MGVGISGLISNLPGTVTPYPTQDPALELGGYRSVPNIAARDAIPNNFRVLGMAVTLQDTGVTYKLIGGLANGNWAPTQDAAIAYIIRADLAQLTAQDNANFPNGCQAYVVAEHEIYQLDTLDPLTTYSPLIIARGAGGTGKWYRRSRHYVIANYTLWCQSWSVGFCGYTPGQLLVSGNTEPDIVISVPGLGQNGQKIGIDNSGDLWLATTTSTIVTVRKWRVADCLRSGSPGPVLTLTTPHIFVRGSTASSLCNVIFDRDNQLWVDVGENASFGSFAFVRFSQRGIRLPNGTPSKTLTGTAAPDPSLGGLIDWAFDGDGNLWVTFPFTQSKGNQGAITMFTRAQLANGGAVLPTVYWTGTNFAGTGNGQVTGMAIASNGLIWVGNYTNTTLKAWPMNGPLTGDPAPTITITCAAFNGVYSLAFDKDGNLWVNNGNANGLMRLKASDLTSSGAKVPDVLITPTVALLENNMVFPNTPERSGLLPSGWLSPV